MDPFGFQNALWNPSPPSDSLDVLIENWNFHLSEGYDEIAYQCPLCFQCKLSLCNTMELREMKQNLRWLEWIWWCTHDKAARTSYRMFMKSNEVAVKAAKKGLLQLYCIHYLVNSNCSRNEVVQVFCMWHMYNICSVSTGLDSSLLY